MQNEDGVLTRNDAAWRKIFDELNIVEKLSEQGRFMITAQQIKDISGREPRLMAKFDHSENLPKIFREYDLAILPISRGSYVIANFNAYHEFENEEVPVRENVGILAQEGAEISIQKDAGMPVQKLALPSQIQSLRADDVFSETVALNCALASGMLNDFLGESELRPTVSGRMRSGEFSFVIHDAETGTPQRVDVNNAQIEIDAAYEGAESLAIIEAKKDLSPDFLVRQLFYPYLAWSQRITKPVRPIFLVYSNGIYRLYEYSFVDPNDYGSIQLVKHKRYAIGDTMIALRDIQGILGEIELVDEPVDVSFPQANSFERVVNLCELLNEQQQLTRDDVTEKYAFDARQTNYYVDAARYLGLVEKCRSDGEVVYTLSAEGARILQLAYKQRQLELCKVILQHRVFRAVFEQALQQEEIPDRREIARILRTLNPEMMSEATMMRRASTVRGWLGWILRLVSGE